MSYFSIRIGEIETSAKDLKETSSNITPQGAEEMAKYGITRVPVDYFHYREFRYTNLADAIAQAKRDEQAG